MSGCSNMRQACENMKKCYLRHANYFGFHSFFNENVLPLAIVFLVIFLLSSLSAIITNYLLPVKVLVIGRFIEFIVYFTMGWTSISLLAFSVESSRQQLADNAIIIVSLLPTLRICWHMGSFFLTMAFHIYIVCFTFR